MDNKLVPPIHLVRDGPAFRQYRGIIREIRKRPDPDDIIGLGYKDSSEELEALVKRGVASHKGHAVAGRRGDLLEEGLAFKNTIGGNEKPLIKGTIGGIDFGARILLSKEEIELALKYQQTLRPQLCPEEWSAVHIDMLQFLFSSTYLNESPFIPSSMVGVVHHFINEPHHFLAYDNPTLTSIRCNPKDLMEGYYRLLWYQYEQEDQKRFKDTGLRYDKKFQFHDFVVRKLFENDPRLYLPFIGVDFKHPRKIEFDYWDIREGKVYGEPDPFLDSGFIFGFNPDVTILLNGAMRRLNSVSLVLALHGLDEVGNGLPYSCDQDYLTMGEFASSFYPKTIKERDDIDGVENRILRNPKGVELRKHIALVFLEKAIEAYGRGEFQIMPQKSCQGKR